jgi:hypothetical protein
MSQELFYTSAPKGLQPGSRGFCTVAATRAMPAALVEKLEALSGYRPLFPPSDPKAGLNPITHAHHRVSVGGKTYHVLSRVCAAGLDYTERTNKFAHHVVLDGGELPAGGPAWLLLQPGFMEAQWDGEVRTLADGRTPPRGNSAPAVCRAWQDATGDAGWAGVVAEAFLEDPNRPVYLVFEPGLDVLALAAEALALLPPRRRWEVTFSTYYTGTAQGIACAWRGVPRGSAEAKNAARLPNALLLQLGIPLGSAEGGALVEQARTGQASPAPAEPNGAADRQVQVASTQAADYHRPRRPQPAVEADPFAEALVAEPAGRPGPPPPAPPRFSRRGGAGSGSRAFGFISGLVAGLLIALGFGAASWGLGLVSLAEPGKKTEKPPSKAPASDAHARPDTDRIDRDRAQRDKEIEAKEKELEGLTKQVARVEKDLARRKEEASQLDASIKQKRDEIARLGAANPKVGPPDPVKNNGPPSVVRQHLRLPPWEPNPREDDLLPELKHKDPTLGLRGPVKVDEKNDLLAERDENGRLCVYVNQEGLGGRRVKKPLARFEQKQNRLTFRWEDAPGPAFDAARRLVRDSVLEVTGPDHPPQDYALRRPLKFQGLYNDGLTRDKRQLYKSRLLWEKEDSPQSKLILGGARLKWGDKEVALPGGAVGGEELVRDTDIKQGDWRLRQVVIRTGAAANGQVDHLAIELNVKDEKGELKLDKEDKTKPEKKPSDSPPPRVELLSLVLYLQVDPQLRVELLRVGKADQ